MSWTGWGWSTRLSYAHQDRSAVWLFQYVTWLLECTELVNSADQICSVKIVMMNNKHKVYRYHGCFTQIVSSAAPLEMVLLHESHLELAILLLELVAISALNFVWSWSILTCKAIVSSCSFLLSSIVLCWACFCMSAKINKNWADPAPFLFSSQLQQSASHPFLLCFRWWNCELFLPLLLFIRSTIYTATCKLAWTWNHLGCWYPPLLLWPLWRY